MAPRSPEDTRRFRRCTVRVLVDYQVDGGRPRCDYATTLGAGGLFIATDAPAARGSLLKMRFRLREDGELHELEGRVCWSRGGDGEPEVRHAPGMGIQFKSPVAASALARELEDLP